MKKLITVLLMLALCVTVFAACNQEPAASDDLKQATNYLYNMYKDSATETGADFQRPAVVKGGNTTFDVEWTVEIVSGTGEVVITVGADKMATIDVPEAGAEDLVYKLTATIKGEKASEKLEYTYTVPKFKIASFEDYLAAENGKQLITEGIVTGVISKTNGASYNCLYYQDANGGYYAYNLSFDPVTENIEVGMKIRVTGLKDLYSGTHEIKDAVVEVIDSNKAPAAAVDFTDLYKNASALNDAALVKQQAMLVTIKGVEITGQDTSNGYYKFSLNGKESYIRISSSVCPVNKDGQNTIKNGHSDHLGWTANVTGVICVYSGNFYLTPVSADAFEYIALPVKDDAGMVEFEKGNLPSLPANITKDTTEIELPTAGAGYNQVTITWASDNACAVVNGNKVVITKPAADTTVKLIATVTSGAVSQTVEYTINVIARTLTQSEIVDLAFQLKQGESLDSAFTLEGVITKIGTAYSEQYGNITVTIKIGDKEIDCYRLKGDGCATLKVGDTITVEGTLTNYKGTIQFKSGCNLKAVSAAAAAASLAKGPRAAAPADAKQTVDAAFALTGTETLENATLTGVIKTVNTPYDSGYGNITVTIEVEGTSGKKELKCYRAKGAEGVDVSGLKVGDTITITGTISLYYEKPQFIAGSQVTTIVPGAGQAVVAPTNPKEIVDAAFALTEGNSLPYEATLTGKIVSIEEAYSSEYKNIRLTMEVEGTTGKKNLVCYRIKGDTDVDISGLAVGDTITVKGNIKNHYGTVEFDSTGRVTKIEKPQAPVVVPTDPKEIVDAAFALEKDAVLPYEATLTGKIVSIEGEYSEQFKNVSVTIEVEGTTGKKNLVCYRVKADANVDITKLAVGDTITVKGTIKNFNGTVEFPSNSLITKVVAATKPSTPVKPNPGTGDYLVSGAVAALVMSAAALVVLKKKEN